MHIQRSDFPHFAQLLKERAKILRREIRDTLLRADEERYANVAGQVHDASEESLADLLVDVNQAEIARDVQELRDVERAQQRIEAGTYGHCGNCGTAISRARLEANPSALRCIKCQEAAEKTSSATPVSL